MTSTCGVSLDVVRSYLWFNILTSYRGPKSGEADGLDGGVHRTWHGVQHLLPSLTVTELGWLRFPVVAGHARKHRVAVAHSERI